MFVFPNNSAANPRRAALGFGVGGTAALLVMAVLPQFFFGFLSPTLPWIQPILPAASQVGLLLAFFTDGAIGGYWLGLGRRSTWGYASGFLVGGLFISQMFTYLRFLSAGQGPCRGSFLLRIHGRSGFWDCGLPGRPLDREFQEIGCAKYCRIHPGRGPGRCLAGQSLPDSLPRQYPGGTTDNHDPYPDGLPDTSPGGGSSDRIRPGIRSLDKNKTELREHGPGRFKTQLIRMGGVAGVPSGGPSNECDD